MPEPISRVVGISYDEFVEEFVVEQHDTPLRSVLGWLETFGVDIHGEYRVYWPADTYVVADGISRRAARILERLFGDPRLFVSPSVGNPKFEIDQPRRDASKSFASLDGRGAARPNARDRLLLVSLNATPEASAHRPDFTPTGQASAAVKYVYFEETIGAEHERERAEFFERHPRK
jgi:hypothetical protein